MLAPLPLRAATPVIVMNNAGFEGIENPSTIYFPDSGTFNNSDTFQNHLDEGGGLFRDILRNEYPNPVSPYPAGPGWWDGDAAGNTRTDRQRVEPKGITGLGHQAPDQTFEYSFDFRTNPGFTATSSFCHIFQLKATNGNDGAPLATISLYKNGSGIQGRVDSWTDGTSGTTSNESVITTFTYTAGQWIHFDIRITPCVQGETTGGIQLSVNGGAFAGVTNAAIDLNKSDDYRPKFGLYRGVSISNGVTNIPVGDSWVEHRTITGYIGTSDVLAWQGGLNNNTWDTGLTANFLNAGASSAFTLLDQVNFTGAANTNVTIAGSVSPGFVDVNSSSNFTFGGTGSIVGGTLKKEGAGTVTLATTNSYPGLTDVRAGTLFVTGSIGNNSLLSVTGGTFKVGSATALGSGAIGAQIAGGTLDINGFNCTTEPVSVQGAGVSGLGAIINSGAQQTSGLTAVTLTGDTTLGGTGRWDVRGTGATLSTGGSAFNLTKVGTNQISIVGSTVDPALANITVSQGVLAIQTSTSSMGDPSKTVTVSSGAILSFFGATSTMTKQFVLNGGTLWGESGSATQNNLAGAITINAAGATFDAGGALTGGTTNPAAFLNIIAPITATGSLTKTGPGTVNIKGAQTWATTSALTAAAGTTNLQSDPGSASAYTLAVNVTPSVGNSSVLHFTTSSTDGVHVRDLRVNAVGASGAGLLVIDAATTGAAPNPVTGFGGAGGSVAVYIGNGAGGIGRASRTTIENLWKSAALEGYWAQRNGAVSSVTRGLTLAAGVVTNPARNGLAIVPSVDSSGHAVTYLGEDVIGDANGDAKVDVNDIGVVLQHLGTTPGTLTGESAYSVYTPAEGDVNGDLVVDVNDLTLALANLNQVYAPSSDAGGASAIPEPATIALAALAAPCLLRRRRHHSAHR